MPTKYQRLRLSTGLAVAAVVLVTQAGRAEHLPDGDPEKGEKLYNGTCVACHGPDGKGAFDGIPDLNGKRGRLVKPDDLLFDHMRDGFQSDGSFMAMPPKGGNPDLGDQDLVDILAYLRKEFGTP